ncbi:MAG: glycoside hydrolase family 38 C-terminal domain-containing protein [Clostridia bacterium]
MKKIHLVCNAHLDPVWLWQWEEGLGEALSTFRIAAEFCEAEDGFIFNHNEALLYEWVEEHDPALFKRIQDLVSLGKWHIMGGWYVQPDCNMPSGESFARQMLYGKRYFMEKFGKAPETAINFDPFGHTRGLVQIMCKAGYTSYLFCRPDSSLKELPGEDFIWEGVDGSRIKAHRSYRFYLSQKGKAADKIRDYMEKHPHRQTGLLLWGIGNHGGGPSRVDLDMIGCLIREKEGEVDIIHSTPEGYFREVPEDIPVFSESLNPFAVGCYTSQIRVKQKHIELENMLYSAEKMMSHAALAGLSAYDRESAKRALKDLLFCEFHDILPGSSIQVAEEDALRQMGRGIQIASELKAKAFYMMLAGQPKAKDGELPIFIYNPHPYPVEDIFECEFMNEFTNTKEKFGLPRITRNGEDVPCQDEREASGLHGFDWRKKVAFRGTLDPCSINRFDLVLEEKDSKPPMGAYEREGAIHIRTRDLEVKIAKDTGLMDLLKVNGRPVLQKGAMRPLVIRDNPDAWGMKVDSFNDVLDSFRLMTESEATAFANVPEGNFDAVRVVDDGEVRVLVEAYMKYQDSRLVLSYLVPKQGTEITVKVRVYWNQTDRMLKISIPTVMENARFMGQIACGTEELKSGGKETVAQKWVAATDGDLAVSVIRDCFYGQSLMDGNILLTLLRSPAYSGHPIGDKLIAEDRYYPRIDQGERLFTFRIIAGDMEEVMGTVDRKAHAFNEKPLVITAYPSGHGNMPGQLLEIDGGQVLLQAFKKAETREGYVVRLYNPLPKPSECVARSRLTGLEARLSFGKHELKTLLVNGDRWEETNILEETLQGRTS